MAGDSSERIGPTDGRPQGDFWTAAEDATLRRLVAQNGSGDWEDKARRKPHTGAGRGREGGGDKTAAGCGERTDEPWVRAGLGTGRSAAATQKRYYTHIKDQEEGTRSSSRTGSGSGSGSYVTKDQEEAAEARGAQPRVPHQQRVEQVVKALRDNPVRRTTQASPPDSAD